ncbi:MAG: hypothetical protein FD124_2601 [Alphaproteobacteria bacterium]|nr:MAG: hypothetical protein FD124_2601 [Alphaproteobacteria bacterium]
MPVEVVRREVQEHRHRAAQAFLKIELIGGELQHVVGARVQRLEIEHARADIAADAHIAARGLQDVADQRRCGGLSVRAGDADDLRAAMRGQRVHGAGEEFDVADDRHADGAREFDHAVRTRMRQRHARREHERREPAPVAGVDVGEDNPFLLGVRACGLVVVPRMHVGGAREERAHG